jgi:hypothetical protein
MASTNLLNFRQNRTHPQQRLKKIDNTVTLSQNES